MDEQQVFVIAVKRERRDDVPRDWMDVVRGTPGVTVMGDATPLNLQVSASPDAIARVRDRFSHYLHIEKLIPHTLS